MFDVLVSANSLGLVVALKQKVSLLCMCLFTPCVCCTVVVVCRFLVSFAIASLQPFYPRAFVALPRLNFLFFMIADESCESRITPFVSELVGSRGVEQSDSCAAHSWDASHQALPMRVTAVLWLVPIVDPPVFKH